MARFDVYPHPDAKLRRATPFLLDVQNSYIAGLSTRVVVPLRPAGTFGLRLSDLNPVVRVAGKDMVLDVPALGAFPAAALTQPTANVAGHAAEISAALDALFGGY